MTDDIENSVSKEAPKQPRTRKAKDKKTPSQEGLSSTTKATRKRRARPFPAGPFDEALKFAKSVFEFSSGQPVRRLSLFNELGKAPDSSASRMLITNSGKYGLTKGGYQSDFIEPTEAAKRYFTEGTSNRERAKIKCQLAIMDIDPFKYIYEKFSNNKLPARAALIDTAKEADVPDDFLEECVDTFIVNLKFVELLQTLSGAERLVSIDHLLDGIPSTPEIKTPSSNSFEYANLDHEPLRREVSLMSKEAADFESSCFYITPIGSDGSTTRQHSDLFLEHIVEPAIKTIGLQVVRADKIGEAGLITRQIIQYILKSRLVIADLSYSNANVFYELAIRHAARLPIVQIIKHGDAIPFDINQMRTIIIDNRDIYTLLPNVEIYKSQIAQQARAALDAGSEIDTPISMYFPEAKLTF